MNRFLALACTTLALGGAAALAQDTKEGTGRAESPQEQPARPADPRQDKAIRGWIRQLGSTEFKEREEAREKLLGAGKDALPLLETATKESGDPEVRWQARKLTREIGRGKAPASEKGEKSQKGEALRQDDLDQPIAPRGFRGGKRVGPLDERFDELFQQLERDFGMRIPRGRFFDDDFFKDLERQAQELRGPGGMDRFQGQGRGFSMQVSPDKVRIEIREKDQDGKDKNDVYEAPDLKSFREKYPEVARKYLHDTDGPGGMGLHFLDPFGTDRFRVVDPNGRLLLRGRGGARALRPDTQGQGEDEAAPPAAEEIPAGERLGVHIKADLSAELREFLGLQENQGLQVMEVLGGELADALGVKAGDILAEINGTRIAGTEPIRTTLKGLENDGEVRLQVFRKGEKLMLKGKKGQRVK
jgi:hypothetical protein